MSNKNPFWGFEWILILHFSKDKHSTHKTKKKKQFDEIVSLPMKNACSHFFFKYSHTRGTIWKHGDHTIALCYLLLLLCREKNVDNFRNVKSDNKLEGEKMSIKYFADERVSNTLKLLHSWETTLHKLAGWSDFLGMMALVVASGDLWMAA